METMLVTIFILWGLWQLTRISAYLSRIADNLEEASEWDAAQYRLETALNEDMPSAALH